MHEVPIVFIFKSSLWNNPIHYSQITPSNMHILAFIHSSSLTLTTVVFENSSFLKTHRHDASWHLLHAYHINTKHLSYYIISSSYVSHHLIIMHHHLHVNIVYIIKSSYNIITSLSSVIKSSYNIFTSSYDIITTSYNIITPSSNIITSSYNINDTCKGH